MQQRYHIVSSHSCSPTCHPSTFHLCFLSQQLYLVQKLLLQFCYQHLSSQQSKAQHCEDCYGEMNSGSVRSNTHVLYICHCLTQSAVSYAQPGTDTLTERGFPLQICGNQIVGISPLNQSISKNNMGIPWTHPLQLDHNFVREG